MSARFNSFIDHIDAEYWREICLAEGELRLYDKGDIFIQEGTVAPYAGYIKTGTLKYVTYAANGDEHVVGLEFGGEFVADFPFSIYGEKARISVVATSECEIYCISSTAIAAMMNRDPMIKDGIMHATKAVFSTVYDRFIALYTLSPQERYQQLIEHCPNLFSSFTLKDIASYLAITPTHLSRIRKSFPKK